MVLDQSAIPSDARREAAIAALAAALRASETAGHLGLIGTDDRHDDRGYPLRRDYTGVENENASELLAYLDANPAAWDALIAYRAPNPGDGLRRSDLELIDGEASAAHDFIWLDEVVALIGGSPGLLARQRQASNAIHSIHNIVRAALSSGAASEEETR